MHNEEMIDRLLEVVQGETKPAIGCTEPVAVALAAATARKYLKEDFKEVNVKVSKNIFKNGNILVLSYHVTPPQYGGERKALLGGRCLDGRGWDWLYPVRG